MFLIAYLVFFLTGLVYGLAQNNRTAVDKWQGEDILMAEEANSSLGMSMFTKKTYEKVEADKKAMLAQTPAVISEKSAKETINATFFGIDPNEFLVPEIDEGEMFVSEDEAVADESLRDQYGLKIGDSLSLSGNETEIKLVGFTKKAKFNVAPVLYISIGTYQKIRFEKADETKNARINAVVTKGKVTALPDKLEQVSIEEFINELPGYSAQVLTFGFMIGFLIVIAAIVIGIFIYFLTMQKTDIFGVMKAQGISSRYISTAVIAQIFLLAVAGIGVGLLATIATAYVLPIRVPFEISRLFLGTISLLMIAFAVLRGFFSVRAVVKIDPLEAIG